MNSHNTSSIPSHSPGKSPLPKASSTRGITGIRGAIAAALLLSGFTPETAAAERFTPAQKKPVDELVLSPAESIIPPIAKKELEKIQELMSNPVYRRGLIHTDTNPLTSVIPSVFSGHEVRMGDNTIIVSPREDGKYMKIVGVQGHIENWSRPGYSPHKFPFFLNGNRLANYTPEESSKKQTFAAYTGEARSGNSESIGSKNWVELLFGHFGNSKKIKETLKQMVETAMKKPDFLHTVQTHVPNWFYNLLQEAGHPYNLIPQSVVDTPEVRGDVICITFQDGDCYNKVSIPTPPAFEKIYTGGNTSEYIRQIRVQSEYPHYVAVGEKGLSDVDVGTIRLSAGPHDQIIDEISFDVLQSGNVPSAGITSVSLGGQKAVVVDGKVTIKGLRIPVSANQIFVDIPVKVNYSGVGEGMVPSGTSPFLTVSGIGYTRNEVRTYEKTPFSPGAFNTTNNTLVHSLPHVFLKSPNQPLTAGAHSHVATIEVTVPPTGDISISRFGLSVTEHGVKIDKNKPVRALLDGAPIDLDTNSSFWHGNNIGVSISGTKEDTFGKITLAAGTTHKLQILLPISEISQDGYIQAGLYDPSTHSSNFGWHDQSHILGFHIYGAGHGTPLLPNFPTEPIKVK